MKNILLLLLLLPCVVVFSKENIDSISLFSKPQTTEHSLLLNGIKVDYTATTGYMQLVDDDGKYKANVFYIAYSKKGVTDASQRPVTFCFNGGPGSSSLWLHIGALGPKRVKMTDEGNALAPPYELIGNDYSWLDITDMVFIDPVGTGFSRPKDGENAEQFFGYAKDIKSIGTFIRLYVNQNNRWASPKYLVGESYGTTRASGLSKYLQEEHGMYLNGISLISCALNFETLREYDGNDLAYICNFPAFTAVAFYHKKISNQYSDNFEKALLEAEAFAVGDYALALLQGDRLDTIKQKNIASRMSELTGLSVEYILANKLRVSSSRFRKELLNDNKLHIGRYDARLSIIDDDLINDYGYYDASFTQIKGAFGTCINDYLRNDLRYKNDFPYKIIGSVSPWEYANGKYLDVSNDLKQAMTVNPNLKVWIASGYYDLATSYFGTEYFLNHLNLPDYLKKNITTTYYNAGHMMYLHKQSLIKLKADAVKFYQIK